MPDGLRFDADFAIHRLANGITGDADEGGALVLQARLDPEMKSAEKLYLQGAIYDPHGPAHGSLTEVIELTVPR